MHGWQSYFSINLIVNRILSVGLALGVCCISLLPAVGQSTNRDTVKMLQTVEITDSRLQLFSSGDQVSEILPQATGYAASNNLAQLLMKYSAINVRSYGISGLSTASLRGSGSNHTPVFWEGINLQSNMNGSLDLTLMPAFFLDDISLQHGSLGAVYGAGTLGGAIHLHSTLESSSGLNGKLFQQLGSFGDRQTGVQLKYGNLHSAVRVRAFYRQADNDFPYYNIYRVRSEERQHAGISQQGVLAEFYQKLSPQQNIEVKYWLQDNYVEVPGVAAAGISSQGIQTDLFHRMVANWTLTNANHQIRARTAILGHRLVYSDNAIENSLNESVSWISEVESTFYLDEEQWLLVGANHTYEQAQVSSYGSRRPQRNRTALFVSYRTLLYDRLEASVGLRETLIDQEWSPILPSLSLAYSVSKFWKLRSKVARSYNLPTFNDLYWSGVSQGNPNLQPESGWGAEFGVEAEPVYNRWKLQGNLTAFSNWFNNWLQWVPLDGAGWSPINVQQVWVRGLEATARAEFEVANDISFQLWGLYSYTRSSKEAIKDGGNPTELRKQLIYTPYHQGKASALLHYRRWELGTTSNIIGEQFTDASNNRVLPSYATTDVSLAYRWPINDAHQLSVNGTLNNIFNHAYEVRQGFPMPGRNYQINIIYQFN
ncbi:TonB-dependent receptor plug domain-containing protein [Tunicatimonas pelagia]|uniref:TonB-dependent receptor plug domain-containing protein n=1 Tax=Tunicatimonas pelagia TaxID=931531 RepID=UPI0026654834|nr:TonB-dependent receptor [Tunicatimonas pelagia]WKN42644.1 TonB-dependent receptor [Tunicatimonas pelagia]